MENTATPWKSRLRILLIAVVFFGIVAQLTILSPSPVEEASQAPIPPIDGDRLITKQETIVPGIPVDQVPDYSIQDFTYVSTRQSVNEWKLVSSVADLYNRQKVVHAKDAKAELYDADKKATLVSGREAKYNTNDRDLEVFGDVLAKFPDGFEVKSPYLKYIPKTGAIEVPTNYPVFGFGQTGPDQTLKFESFGMRYDRNAQVITLPKDVRITVEKKKGNPEESWTKVHSDICVIFRNQNLAEFTMQPSRKLDERFVKIEQPKLFAQGRKAELNYEEKTVRYLTVLQDVTIRELGNTETKRHGTAGRAEFDSQKRVVVLRDFPQVYQDGDTVTGEVIILHRDTDIVEVDYSNAYSEGKSKQPPKQPAGPTKSRP